MKVAVLMGSDSDWPILKPAVELLKQFGITPVIKVASAHRTPSIVRDFVMEADHDKEFAAFIVAAGAAISVICYLSLLAAAKVSRWLGETGLTVLNRIMGMLLAAVAVEIVIAGIRSLFPQLTV